MHFLVLVDEHAIVSHEVVLGDALLVLATQLVLLNLPRQWLNDYSLFRLAALANLACAAWVVSVG